MKSSPTLKSASRTYNKKPFYSKQKKNRDKRYVAFFNDGANIKLFINSFCAKATSFLDIQLRDLDSPEKPVNYTGRIRKIDWPAIFLAHEEIILRDGFNELMIKIPETKEYIAYDDHGLIYIYTDKNYSKQLKDYGLKYKRKGKYIYQVNHWHIRPANAEQNLQALVLEMGLNKNK